MVAQRSLETILGKRLRLTFTSLLAVEGAAGPQNPGETNPRSMAGF